MPDVPFFKKEDDGMEIDVISGMISNLGFPILAYLLMVKTNNDMTKAHKEEVKEMNEQFEKRMDKMIDSLDNNTKVIEEMKVFLESKENEK